MKRKVDGQPDLLALDSVQSAPPPAAKSPSTDTSKPAISSDKVLVRKRDGSTEPFSRARIAVAIESAFKAVRNIPADEPMTGAMNEIVSGLADKISQWLLDHARKGANLDVERIQDSVENQMMCDGYLTEARRYILYREDRRKSREEKTEVPQTIYVVRRDGRREEFDPERIRHRLTEAAAGLEGCDVDALLREVKGFIADGTATAQITDILVATAKARRDVCAACGKIASRLLLKEIYSQTIPEICPAKEFPALHQARFSYAIQDAVHNNQLAPELLGYELEHLASALKLERDELLAVDGLEWMADVCLARDGERRVETPQYFWMRVAMALAFNEGEEKENRAIEFYEALSTLRFLPSEKLLRVCGRSSAIIARNASSESEDVQLTARPGGHVNLAGHVQAGALDELLLYNTVTTGVRLLDNAIDFKKDRLDAMAQHARDHRDIAIGIIGYDAAGASLDLADRATEAVAYCAALSSAVLAGERDSYPACSESNWTIGALPFEGLKFAKADSNTPSQTNRAPSKDWTSVRAAIKQNGIRNGHLLALTPAPALEKLISDASLPASFSSQLERTVRCRKWVDGPVWITLPQYLTGPDFEQACLLAQQLGIRPFTPPVRLTMSDDHLLIDAAAATKVLKHLVSKGS